MFWLSYECFSIVCNAFLLKSAISSHNSCAGYIFKSSTSVSNWQACFFKWKAKCPGFHFLNLSTTILSLIQPKISKNAQNFYRFFQIFLFNPLYDFRIQGQVYRLIIQLGQIRSTQKSTANMLSRRCQNSRKSENTQVSEVNSNLYLEICQKHDTSLQSRDISCFSAFYSILLSFFVLKISGIS